MSTLGAFLLSLAGTISLWRDLAIMGLALVVIGCLWLYATAVAE